MSTRLVKIGIFQSFEWNQYYRANATLYFTLTLRADSWVSPYLRVGTLVKKPALSDEPSSGTRHREMNWETNPLSRHHYTKEANL